MYLDSPTAATKITIPPEDFYDPYYRVAETLFERGSGPVNEDAFAASDRLCIVCDGATSLAGLPGKNYAKVNGGQRAAAMTASLFSSNPEQDLLDSVRAANTMIRDAMTDHRVDLHDRAQLWSTSFAAVQIRGRVINWCQTGDCMILLVYEDGTSRRLTTLPGQDVEVLKKWQRIGARAEGTIHQVLAEDITAVRQTMNRNFGVLNGEHEALDFIASGTVEDDRVSTILLFSDGLFPPSDNPDKGFDENLFVDLYRNGGLKRVKNHVRTLQVEDPHCYRYPRFKTFDDISAVALKRG